MNTIITRCLAAPVLGAAIIGGAAVGLAGTASASPAYQPQPRPGIVATPSVTVRPPAPPRIRHRVLTPADLGGGDYALAGD
jgi:hypothetical protein